MTKRKDYSVKTDIGRLTVTIDDYGDDGWEYYDVQNSDGESLYMSDIFFMRDGKYIDGHEYLKHFVEAAMEIDDDK